MDAGFITEFNGDLQTEFEMYFEFFKKYCEGTDYEFGMKVWNKLMNLSFIRYDEKEVLETFYAVAAEPFESANAQKWFIKAHVAFRKWKANDNKTKKFKGSISH